MESRTPGGGACLLIVAHDRRIRRALRLLFATLPDSVRVVAASSVDAVLRRTAELSPGVALVDLAASDGIAGVQVLRDLTAGGWSVVALGSQRRLEPAALAHGAAAFVDTGVDPDEIVGLVRELLGHPQRDGRSDAIGAAD